MRIKTKKSSILFYKQYHSTIYFTNLSDYKITYENEIILHEKDHFGFIFI